ncbi:MAG: hypothetical protein OEM02_09060 [Desulfobulbaceae bacterium]|nr:hypothetical protein [Desulfobulbaceae bacterium]
MLEAQDTSGNPFYELLDVELEVSFALEAKGKGKTKFVVVELGGEATGTQVHKVRLSFKPLAFSDNEDSEATGGGGAGGGNAPSPGHFYEPHK